MFKQKEKKASGKVKQIGFSFHGITRVLEYEHTPIIAAATVGFLAGVIVGFAMSPIKKGVRIGCNNKAVTNEYDDEYDEDITDYEEDD